MSDVSLGVPLLDVEDLVLTRLAARNISVGNLYRALGHSPQLLDAWLDFAGDVRGRCSLPRALRELVILRTAVLAGNRYIWSDHVPMALEAGLSTARVQAVAEWQRGGMFDKGECAALRLADELSCPPFVTEETLASLSESFTPQERVELVLTAGFYAMVARVLVALRVPLPDRSLAVPFPELPACGSS